MFIFKKDWWKYIFAPRSDKEISWLKIIYCRWKGHTCGPVFYNTGGLEPNWCCKNCRDYIG